MDVKKWLKHERLIFHKRFIPSLISGIAVSIIAFFFQATASNIIMFASLGASAVIISHRYVHKLTILRTVIFSYLLALIVSISLLLFVSKLNLSFSIATLLAVTITTILLYLFNIFHPPAVAASLSFIIMDTGFIETLVIFISIIILLVVMKLLTYAFYYEHLELKKFHHEFKKLEKKI